MLHKVKWFSYAGVCASCGDVHVPLTTAAVVFNSFPNTVWAVETRFRLFWNSLNIIYIRIKINRMGKIILFDFSARNNAIRCLQFSSPMVRWNRRLSYSLRTTNLLIQIVICIFYRYGNRTETNEFINTLN